MRRALVAVSAAILTLVTVTACGRPRTSAAPDGQPAASAAAADSKAAGVTGDGQVVPEAPAAGGATPSMMTSHAPAATATKVDPIAAPPGGLSIADVFAKRDALAGTQVTVRGKVVKVNNQIMGRNWVHIQDGSGSASDRTNDLTVTTVAEVRTGEIVTATGVLAARKEIGEGYAYDALLENATIVR